MKFKNYLNEGKLSLAEVIKLAKKYGGGMATKQDKGKPWTIFVFSDIGPHGEKDEKMKKFAKDLQKNHMTLKVDKMIEPYNRNVDYGRVKVWF